MQIGQMAVLHNFAHISVATQVVANATNVGFATGFIKFGQVAVFNKGIIKIRQMSVFNNIDKSSIHVGLRDFDKKCYKRGSGATLQYTLTDQNALKCSVLKSWTAGRVFIPFCSFFSLSALCGPLVGQINERE